MYFALFVKSGINIHPLIECGNQNPDFVLVYDNNDDGYLGIVFAREKCSTRTVSHDNPPSLCINVPYKDFYLDMKSKSVMVTIKSSKLHPYNEMEKCPTICDQSCLYFTKEK